MKKVCLILVLLLLLPACGPQTSARVMQKSTFTSIDVSDDFDMQAPTTQSASTTPQETFLDEEADSSDDGTIILPEALEATDEAVIID